MYADWLMEPEHGTFSNAERERASREPRGPGTTSASRSLRCYTRPHHVPVDPAARNRGDRPARFVPALELVGAPGWFDVPIVARVVTVEPSMRLTFANAGARFESHMA